MECGAEGSRPTTDLTRRQSNGGPRFLWKHRRATSLPGEEALHKGQKRRQQGVHICDLALCHLHMQALTGTHTLVVNLSATSSLGGAVTLSSLDLRRLCEPLCSRPGAGWSWPARLVPPRGPRSLCSKGPSLVGGHRPPENEFLGRKEQQTRRHQDAEGLGWVWTQVLLSPHRPPAPPTVPKNPDSHYKGVVVPDVGWGAVGDLSRPLPRTPRHSLCGLGPAAFSGPGMDMAALSSWSLKTGGQGLCCDAQLRGGHRPTPLRTSRLRPHVPVPLLPCSGPNPQGPPSLT